MLDNRVATKAESTDERLALLELEKEATKMRDEVARRRAELPFVPVDPDYTFEGPNGETLKLLDLFEGRRQLIVRHFMFGPDETRAASAAPCRRTASATSPTCGPGTPRFAAGLPGAAGEVRSPSRPAWAGTYPWYSSFGNDFNYDYE